MGTFVVGAILVLIVGLIVRGIVKDKKSGKSSCGGDCSHCRGCHGSKSSRNYLEVYYLTRILNSYKQTINRNKLSGRMM